MRKGFEMLGIDRFGILWHEFVSALHEVVGKQAPCDIWIENRDRDYISIHDQRLIHAMNGATFTPEAGNLRDLEGGELGFGMALCVFHQGKSYVFRRRHAGIRKERATKLMREVIVQNESIEVGAVVVFEIEVRNVGERIDASDELPILLRGGCEAKNIGASVIGRADQLLPAVMKGAALRQSFAECAEQGFTIVTSETLDGFDIDL